MVYDLGFGVWVGGLKVFGPVSVPHNLERVDLVAALVRVVLGYRVDPVHLLPPDASLSKLERFS